MKLNPLILLIALFCSCSQWQYDKFSGQKPVESKEEIDNVLATLEKLTYSDLSEHYKERTGNIGVFKKMVENGTFYRIREQDASKFIVGSIRLGNLLTHDRRHKIDLNRKSYQQIWLIDKHLLYKLLELKLELGKKGFDPDGFVVRDGHRHPAHNKLIGGASRSQHIAGKAVDIVITDINQDGKANKIDKQIVLDLLDKKVIQDLGGIGRYPGTMVVHFDVRGKKARWDSY